MPSTPQQPQNLNLDLSILFAICVFLCLAIGIIVFVILYQRRVINHQEQIKCLHEQQQHALVQASIQSEEEERMRIAAELHDDVGATLSSVRLFLSRARHNSCNDQVISQSKELLDATIQKIRNISHQLQPSTLQYLGLQKSLQSLADLINRTGAIEAHYNYEPDWPQAAPQTELAIYRIIQETVNNIIKHSGASAIYIAAGMHGPSSYLSISHNGSGLTSKTYHELLHKKGAIGLKNIENRLKSINATIEFLAPVANIHTLKFWLPAHN